HFGTEPFLKLETGKVRLKLVPLLTGRVELGDIKLTKPVITVIQAADGRMNISTLGGPKEPPSEPKAAERAPRGGGGTGGGGAAPAVGGALKGKLALSGTLGSPAVAGDIELAKPSVSQLQPSCPEPKRRTLTLGTLKLNAGYRDQMLAARPLTTALGDGTITGQLSLSLAQGMRVQLADLAIKALPLEKALVD